LPESIKAAPHSFSNEGDAFSRPSTGLLNAVKRSKQMYHDGPAGIIAIHSTTERNNRRHDRSEGKALVLACPGMSLVSAGNVPITPIFSFQRTGERKF